MKIATRWEVKIDGNKRSIQLFDADGNKLKGSDAKFVGSLYCHNNQLTSLEGAPKEVGGSFYCSNNQLTSLEGAPKEVGGNFYGHNNQLTSLEGAPKEVGGGFYCDSNQLTSLEGAPKEVGGNFYCDNNQLTSLEGAPKEVGGSFYCSNNQLTSLEGAPKEVGGDFNCGINQLTSLEGAPKTRSTGVHARIRKAKLARGLLWADGILLRILSKKRTGNTTIYRCRKIGSKAVVYVAQRGDTFSHGTTAREAVSDLIFKTEKRDVEEYKKWSRNKVVSKAKAIEAYRSITGACSFGVKDFCAGRKIPARLSVSKIIEITKGKYGNDTFRNFKWGNK